METPTPVTPPSPVSPLSPSAPKSKRWILYVLLAVLLLMAGCSMIAGYVASKVAEKVIEVGSGVDIDRDNGAMTFTKDGETMTVSVPADNGNGDTPVDMPLNFPADFPVPEDMRATSASSFTMEGKNAFIVTWQTTDSLEDITAYYQKHLTEKGWKSVMTNTDTQGAYLMWGRGDETNGQSPEGAMIQIARGEEGVSMVSLTLSQPAN